MARPTHLYVVGSPRPRVGKTLVARVLTEFYRADGRPVTAYDLSRGENTLADFLPKFAVRASIAHTKGQMELFDQLIVGDERPKVVDLDLDAFESFFRIMTEIEFVAEARRRSIEPLVLFIVNPDDRSVTSYAELGRRFADLTIVPVHNDGIVRGSHLRDKFPGRGPIALPLQIPALSPSLRHVIGTCPFSFVEFKRRPSLDLPGMLENELNSWMKRVFLQFRELELRLLLSKLKASLQPQPQQQDVSAAEGIPGEPQRAAGAQRA